MVRAVLFDAGGVLVLPRGDRVAETFAICGLDLAADTCRDAWSFSLAREDQLGHPAGAEIRAGWVELAGVPSAYHRRVVEALGAALHPPRAGWHEAVDGAAAVLEALHDSGYRLGCVSNADGQVAAELELLGLAGYFEVIVDSHHVGVEKPSPRIFEICLERMGDLTPAECVYVGDTIFFDVAPAVAFGMTSCHFDRLGCYSTMPPAGVRIGRLDDLPLAIERIASTGSS